MKKYIGESGLLYLWEKIKEKFVNKQTFETSERVISSALNDLNDRKLNSEDLPEILAITNLEIQNLN